MLRFWVVIIISIPFIIYYIRVGKYIEKNPEKYTEYDRYRVAKKVLRVLRCNGGIFTSVYGKENLPSDGGYIMYSNHQGKYDAIGIMYGHQKPCTILMDEKRSRLPIINPFMDLIQGSRLNKDDIRSQVATLKKIVNEVKAGRKYIIFPEGGYDKNHNQVHAFKAGAFKSAIRAKCPIVPVAIADSYKVFEQINLSPVHTKVMYLKPIYYDEYKDMSTEQIAIIVRARIMIAVAQMKKKHVLSKIELSFDENVFNVDLAKQYIEQIQYIMQCK